jgi:DNA-binding FadR family transcriptional regulator
VPIQSVESKRLYRQIAEQLRSLIEQGEFVVGARLPAERDLASQLGVSRPSVREALIALEVEGWVEVRTGSGVYVLERARQVTHSPVAPNEWGPLELIRARRMLEGETAALAATQARQANLVAMREAIDAMACSANQGVMPLAGDRAFHCAIVRACDNEVLMDTIAHYWDARHGPLFVRLGGHFETLPSWRSAIEEHEAVYQAILARDAAAARQAMHAHLDNSHQRFTASWTQPPRGGAREA